MRSPSVPVIGLYSVLLLGACHYDAERHRLAQDRKLYDDLCARGHNVWRMKYEGTDSAWHYFLVNDKDRWAHVKIPKPEIGMKELEPFPSSPDDTLNGYWVDPCDDFRKSGA